MRWGVLEETLEVGSREIPRLSRDRLPCIWMTPCKWEKLKYLGCILTSTDDDWLAVVKNIKIYRKKWAGMPQILGCEGVDARTSGLFNKALVQAVFLFGLETWVVTPI